MAISEGGYCNFLDTPDFIVIARKCCGTWLVLGALAIPSRVMGN